MADSPGARMPIAPIGKALGIAAASLMLQPLRSIGMEPSLVNSMNSPLSPACIHSLMRSGVVRSGAYSRTARLRSASAAR